MSNISSLVEGLSQGLNGYLQAGQQQQRQQENAAFVQQQAQQTHAVEGQSDIDQAGKVTPDMAEQLIPGASKWVNNFHQANGRLPTIDEVSKGLDSVTEKLDAIKTKNSGANLLVGAQKSYTTDAALKKEQEALNGANSAEDQVHLAISNPVAYSSVPITLARMMTGSSRINQQEITRLGGSQAIMDRANQFATQMGSGTVTPENAQWMEDLVSTLKKSHQQNIEDIGVQHASQYRRLSGQSLPDAYLNVTGNPIPDRYTKSPSQRVPAGTQPGANDAATLATKKAALKAKLGI